MHSSPKLSWPDNLIPSRPYWLTLKLPCLYPGSKPSLTISWDEPVKASEHKIHAARLSHWVWVDSAGTHNFHPGNPPDQRSQEHARRRRYDLSELRARQITADDYDRHDLILVMDWDNLALVEDACEGLIKHVARNGSS